MDARDWQIIEILNKNSRTSNSEIARSLGISEGTVRLRVDKLLKSGAIRNFTLSLGSGIFNSLILVKVEPEESKKILQVIKTRFEEVYELSGSFDMSVRVIAPNLDRINEAADFIRSIDGVIETDTLIRLT